jgi:molybdopterin converting factor small subunit
MRITVLLFGAERDAAGTPRALVELSHDRSCATLRGALGKAIPALQDALLTARFAVNGEFAPDSHVLAEGDEVALIGPVGGG